MTRGWVDLSASSKLLFEGAQALWFLDQLITNKVDDLDEGRGADALLLSPNGKITAQLSIVTTSTGVLVDAGSREAQDLLDFFQMRIFATKVQISDVTSEFALIRVVGAEGVEAALKQLGEGELAKDHLAVRPIAPGFVVRLANPLEGLDLWLKAEEKARTLSALDQVLPQISPGDYENIRVAAGAPLFGKDFDDTFLPQEAAMERAVHFQKGCYLGQEAVAMTQRGRIKRRLRHFHFEGAPRRGRVTHDGIESGKVTSIGVLDGSGYGIATVKTTVPVGAHVIVVEEGESTAVVQELPGTTQGPKVPSARELREALKGQSPAG